MSRLSPSMIRSLEHQLFEGIVPFDHRDEEAYKLTGMVEIHIRHNKAIPSDLYICHMSTFSILVRVGSGCCVWDLFSFCVWLRERRTPQNK
jgi:hypothetical protein